MKLDRLINMEARFREVETLLADPDVLKDRNRYKELMQEHSHLSEVMTVYHKYTSLVEEIASTKELYELESEGELREMAKLELHELQERLPELEEQLKLLLVHKDPLDGKNIIMEIRAGTGGDEAALFASDLYRMYTHYAETIGWKLEILELNETEIGGIKEIIFSLSGKEVYGYLRYESGGHRVQRVPTTESGGRIHTSAVTVAVLPEAEETEIDIKPEDIKVDVFRSSGPGGQSVNTTDSAVRVTHHATGLVVTCQDEKSQIKNRAKAMRVLRARLYDLEEDKKQQERAQSRKSQVGSGDRSERIRTYNYPQNRVTDHRINLTLYKLDSILTGNMEEIIDALRIASLEEQLQEG